MLGAAILWIGLGTVGAGDYLRPFGAKVFDQATLDAETFGAKPGLVREDDGLRVTVAPGALEAGWKTPQALRLGGDCAITAILDIRKLPKPGGEDGVAIGLAVATQDIDHPEATLLREVEPDGKEIFRSVDKGGADPSGGMGMRMNRMMVMPFGFNPPGKPAKPVRHTVPAKGSAIRLAIHRQGSTVRYLVSDEVATQPREIGHFDIGPGDIVGVKIFLSNRNGTEPVDVLIRDLTIHADRLSGLGTAVRTVFGSVLHGDPTALDGGTLVIGGPPAAPAPVAATPVPAPAPSVVAAAPTAPAPAAPEDTKVTTTVVVATPAPTSINLGSFVVSAVPAGPGVPGAPVVPGVAAAPTPTSPQPPKRVALDEVETIAFERSATLAGRFLGQPNVDATQSMGTDQDQDKDKPKEPVAKPPAAGDDLAAPPPGTAPVVKVAKVEAKPNGIRDLHIGLSSLRPAAIRQVVIQCQTDKGATSWQLDTTGSPAWPVVIARAGMETWADLFFEPPPGDCHEKNFTINLTYADGQAANTQVKATTHSDPKLAFDAESPTPALDARVFLAGAEQLFGKLEAITEDALTLTTPWGDRLDIPLSRITGVYMGMPDHKESADSFAKRLKARGDQDQLLARAKDGEVVAIAGVVEGSKANKLTFQYQGKSRTLPLKGVEGLILASRPAPAPPTEVRPTFDLAGGIVLSGRWVAIDPTTWQVETPWGQIVKLPAAEVRHVRVRGGQMTFLSDLEPSQVEEVAYFGRQNPFRKDVNLAGGPLKVDGQVLDKGLAVHSQSALTFDLDRKFATFEALVGFDAASGKQGRVDCRVFADGKEIYANPDLRADAPATRLSLPVAGAEQLRLVVGFGPDEDTGDRVIWGNARLFRRPPALGPTIPAPAPTPAATPAPTPSPTSSR